MARPSYPAPSGTNPELERIRAWVGAYFPVYETRLTPNSLILLVHADPASLEFRFDRLRQELWPRMYVPQIRYERGEYTIEIVRRPARSTWGPWVNLLLLALTGVTTVTAGAIFWLNFEGGSTLVPGDFAYGALFFGAPVMAILGIHELAHFVLARYHHVDASFPFFLPVPPPYLLFGTFGAFISLREPIPSKKALLDIGAAGPLAGFAVAIPVTIGGMFLSAHTPALSVANCGPVVLGVPVGGLLFGRSFLWDLLGLFLPSSMQHLQPLALAGWVGLLVTAMNLLPAGQLDGGHVFRALFGPRTTYVSVIAVLALIGVGIVFDYAGWILFGFLILFLGVRHPPPLNDLTKLDAKRWAVGALALAVLVGGFVLVPLAQPTGTFTLVQHSWAPNGPPPGGGMSDNLSLVVQDQDVVATAYVLSGEVTGAVGSFGGGGTAPLNESALAAFEANSSWSVVLPNGNVTSFNGTGTFALDHAQYVAIDSGANATFRVTFRNPVQATVSITLSVATLCDLGMTSQSTSYQVN
ncbi:MAG TPA: site-2 protease family protein [Thermoplasmata archaeon]|nr:site-2 protease family protein [Thermoplasmata archaeon]